MLHGFYILGCRSIKRGKHRVSSALRNPHLCLLTLLGKEEGNIINKQNALKVVLVFGWRFATIDLVRVVMSFLHNSGYPLCCLHRI
jgi:hypothetical protein